MLKEESKILKCDDTTVHQKYGVTYPFSVAVILQCSHDSAKVFTLLLQAFCTGIAARGRNARLLVFCYYTARCSSSARSGKREHYKIRVCQVGTIKVSGSKKCVVVYCSVLQCVAVCCSVLR